MLSPAVLPISRQTDKKTAVIIHEYVSAGRQILLEKLQHHLNAGIQIIIFDAKDEEDIDLIIKALEGAVKEKLSLIQTLNV